MNRTSTQTAKLATMQSLAVDISKAPVVNLNDRSAFSVVSSDEDSAESWRSEYPFKSNLLSMDGCNLNYVDEGDRDATPILMVHGNPTWSFYWRNLISSLRSEYRPIAVDHIGCGLSDKPVNYSYCLEQHIDNLCEVIDHLQLKNAVLMVHDWGGSIGIGALLRRRECFKRIVVFNTAAFPPPYIPFRIRVCRWPLVGKLGVQGLNMFARAAVVMATEQKGGLAKKIAQGFLAPYDSWANRTAIYQFVKDIPLSPKHETWSVLQKIESELPSLRDVPIQLIWGMKDWCFRVECLRRFQSHWPNANVLEIDDAGHYVIEDAIEETTNSVKQFLANS